MTRLGYARVSDGDPDPGRQEGALRAAGCSLIFTDHGQAGALDARPGLDAALAHARAGDTLAVASLDRFGLAPRQLAELLGGLLTREVTVHVSALALTVRPGSDAARLTAAILAAGQQVAGERARPGGGGRPRGRAGGRKPKLTARQVASIRAARGRGETVPAIAARYGVSGNTVYRALGQMPGR